METIKKIKRSYKVYIHYNKVTGEPFYVGKGLAKRPESINMNPDTLEYFLNNPETVNTTYFQYLN